MIKVVVINGAPGAGKDKFIELCASIAHPSNLIHNFSTVDKVKEIARIVGWNGEKTPEARKFLSDLKRIFVEWNDLPMIELEKRYKRIEDNIKVRNNLRDNKEFGVSIYSYVDIIYGPFSPTSEYETGAVLFVHCRESEEIKKIVDKYNAITLLIRRETAENNETSNSSDSKIFDYNYNFTIDNNSDIINLKEKAKIFLREIGMRVRE